MKVTKELLQETKRSISWRIGTILNMSESEIRGEFSRRWPDRNAETLPHWEILRYELITDCVNRSIPSNWGE